MGLYYVEYYGRIESDIKAAIIKATSMKTAIEIVELKIKIDYMMDNSEFHITFCDEMDIDYINV